MKRHGHPDHLSSSLTDLMTSLMVIFVLLLVTKLNNQASEATSAVNRVLAKLEARARKLGDNEKIYRQGDVIVIVIPDELMSFQQGSAQQGGAELSEIGRRYLQRHIPDWSALLCDTEIRRDIDTIVVEGHSDRRPFGKVDPKVSKAMNLELSQQRSMAVVAEALSNLDGSPHQACFLDLLSATGRGDAHPVDEANPDSEKNRRVEVRIRVRPNVADSVSTHTGGNKER
ncbi:MAG: OmpA family protein, partial [Fimbriimonadaceae bacterium]|nr:OmpA family protein [Fimbriimonadaceae bacterium]